MKLNQYFRPMYICPTCEVLRPRESRHCFICNRCIDRHDHHCQWINRCVGIGNHNYFLAYLYVIWIYLFYLLVMCFVNITVRIGPADILTASRTRLFLFPYFSESQEQVAFDVTLAFVILLDLFFLAPLTLLLVIQSLNYLHAQTTSARMKRNKQPAGLMIQEVDGPMYAREALINHKDRSRLFVDRDRAAQFSKDFTKQQQSEILSSVEGSP